MWIPREILCKILFSSQSISSSSIFWNKCFLFILCNCHKSCCLHYAMHSNWDKVSVCCGIGFLCAVLVYGALFWKASCLLCWMLPSPSYKCYVANCTGVKKKTFVPNTAVISIWKIQWLLYVHGALRIRKANFVVVVNVYIFFYTGIQCISHNVRFFLLVHISQAVCVFSSI